MARVQATSGLSWLLVLYSAPRGFSPGSPVFPSPNLRSGVPFVFVGSGKERLIQLLDYSSVASPQSGLFSDWSRNKRVLELSHDWLPVWQCDFRSKKFPRADKFDHGV